MGKKTKPTALALALVVLSFAPTVSAADEPDLDAVRQGYEQLYRGDIEGAYRYFQGLAERHPGSLAADLGLLLAVQDRDLPQAEKEKQFVALADGLVAQAEARLKKDARDAEALFHLAQALMLRGINRFGRRSFWSAFRDAARAKRTSEEFVRLQPDRADVYLGLGLYNYFMGILPTIAKVLRIFFFLPGGNRALGLEQIERAARQGDLFATQAQLQLMQIYALFENRPEEALRLVEDLKRRYPDNPEIGFRAALLYASPSVDAPAEAARELRGILRRVEAAHPNYPRRERYAALFRLALAEQQQWLLSEAIQTLTPVIDEAPVEPDWVLPQFLFTRANQRNLAGDLEASEDAQRILSEKKWKDWHKRVRDLLKRMEERQRSGEAAVYAELIPGNRLVAEGRWADAARFYERIRHERPDDWQVRYRLAYLEFARGEYSRATAAFDEIIQSNPFDGRQSQGKPGRMPEWLKANALLHRAQLHDLGGEREAAIKLYRKVADDYEEERAAGLARLGLLAPYRRITLPARTAGR